MNLKNEAPWEWLVGYRHIHRQQGENKGGPALTSGYYLGDIQKSQLEYELDWRNEDGARGAEPRRRRISTLLSFGIPPSKAFYKAQAGRNNTS